MTAAPKHDVIVVLGTKVRPDGTASPALARRVARGIELFRSGYGGALLMCGGVGRYPPAEASVMRDLALAAGIDAASVFVEDTSRTTLENAINAREIMGRQGWSSALLVTDVFHLPRAMLAFRSVGVRVTGKAAKSGPNGRFRRRWQFLVYEGIALPWYVIQIVFGRHRR